MSDGDAEDISTEPLPARPTAPKLSGRRRGSSRPARPGSKSTSPGELEPPEIEPLPEFEPAVAEAAVIAPPPEPELPPKSKRSPVNLGSAEFQKTLLPPCVVLAVGCLLFGGAYFTQQTDSAIRRISPGIPIALLAVGVACTMTAAILRRSLRRID